MESLTILAVLVIGQADRQLSPDELPPTLRAEIPAGKMAVYDLRYSRELPNPTPGRPRRLYVPASELEEPGVWGDHFAVVEREPAPGILPEQQARRNMDGFLLRDPSGVWHGWGSAYVHGPSGVLARFDPCLFGFFERFTDTPEARHSFRLLSSGSSLVACGKDPDGLWFARTEWAGWATPHVNPSAVFKFHPRSKSFVSARVENVYLADVLHVNFCREGKAQQCNHPPETPVEVDFTLASTEVFPPPDLDSRIRSAIERGTLYLSEQAPEIRKCVWFQAYPAGTRSLVAWAILAGGGDPKLAASLLEEAIREPLETTYDASFLVVALDALLEHEIGEPEARPVEETAAPRGRTSVSRHRTSVRALPAGKERTRFEKSLEAAVSYLVGARESKGGLWGYNRGALRCEMTKPCMHTTCAPEHREKQFLDISNTYWALDALSVAARRGLRIPPAVWDGAVRSLTAWGTYFRNVHVPRYRHIWGWGNDSQPREAREFFLDRDRRDTVLRMTRSLRVQGYPGGALSPEEHVSKLEEASFWPYTNYVMKYSLSNFHDNLGDLFNHTNGYASQVSGVGALVLSLEGLGQKALRSRVVEQGLLYARVHFRHILATMDLRPCTEGDVACNSHHFLPPRDIGYSFLLLERVLDGLGIERLGSHDWFPLLALHSLDLQCEDGGWYPWREDRLVPTALHVLALSRGRGPDFSEELPVYRRGPIVTGPGRVAPGLGAALVESKDGKLHRVVEVLASLERLGSEARIDLAEKAIEGLTPEQRAEVLPLLRRVAEDGPAPSKSFARKAIVGMEGQGAKAGGK